MANQEQLERLKQGVEGWNKWRKENLLVEVDLSSADLRGIDLVQANLWSADLRHADLSGVDLREADLRHTNLSSANLSKANLNRADLRRSNLREANLWEAHLDDASLVQADPRGANFGRCLFIHTGLRDIDLSETSGLLETWHEGPSEINTSTLRLSKGKIPGIFLRGCGLSDWEIESAKLYQPELSAKEVNDIVYRIYDLRANRAIQINPLFISYSHADRNFVDKVENKLDEKGIRFWRDIHDATSGRLEKVVDRAIRQNPTMLLILSEHSVKSDWVEHEARTARELEKELGRDVLCPIALDDAWKDCKWPVRLREQIMEYNILNFSKWKDDAEFAKMFHKLVDGLDLFYK